MKAIECIETNNTNLLKFTIAIMLTWIPGLFLKLLFPLSNDYFGRDSYVTGIPFLRKHQLLEIMSLNILIILYIWIKHRSFKILMKMKIGFFFKNLIPFTLYYFLLKNMRTSLSQYDFRISGHYMISLLSMFVIANNKTTFDWINELDINDYFTTFLSFINYFILLHYCYTLVFTFWIYHSILEVTIACIICVTLNFFINTIEIDDFIIWIIKSGFYNNTNTESIFLEDGYVRSNLISTDETKYKLLE